MCFLKTVVWGVGNEESMTEKWTNKSFQIRLLWQCGAGSFVVVHSWEFTFRKGITKGRRGKLVASWSLEWNSSMVSVEFWSRGEEKNTHQRMWKALHDNITHWKLAVCWLGVSGLVSVIGNRWRRARSKKSAKQGDTSPSVIKTIKHVGVIEKRISGSF